MKKKVYPRSKFETFSATHLIDVQEQVKNWNERNPEIQILKTSIKPTTNDVNEGAKWYEIEIEYLE